MEIAASGNERSEAVLRKLFQLDPPGERFPQLLHLVDDAPAERGIGENELIEGIKPMSRREFGKFIDQFDTVWNW